jgi:predicted amidohydrolase
MKMCALLIAAPLATLIGCAPRSGRAPGGSDEAPPPAVRVAAVQFHSVMGDPEGNRRRLVPLVERAAAAGAKVVVLPECAVPGYADLTNDVFWTSAEGGEEGCLPVSEVAEPARAARASASSHPWRGGSAYT